MLGYLGAVVSDIHSNVNSLSKQAFRLFRFVEIVVYTKYRPPIWGVAVDLSPALVHTHDVKD